jgi:hypothetical protein
LKEPTALQKELMAEETTDGMRTVVFRKEVALMVTHALTKTNLAQGLHAGKRGRTQTLLVSLVFLV